MLRLLKSGLAAKAKETLERKKERPPLERQQSAAPLVAALQCHQPTGKKHIEPDLFDIRVLPLKQDGVMLVRTGETAMIGPLNADKDAFDIAAAATKARSRLIGATSLVGRRLSRSRSRSSSSHSILRTAENRKGLAVEVVVPDTAITAEGVAIADIVVARPAIDRHPLDLLLQDLEVGLDQGQLLYYTLLFLCSTRAQCAYLATDVYVSIIKRTYTNIYDALLPNLFYRSRTRSRSDSRSTSSSASSLSGSGSDDSASDKDRSRSRSLSIPRRHGSPSFLDRRRITRHR
nr:unnamed protein product [Callosobruchus chinensis]